MSTPVEWWAPPLRSMATGHRVAGYPGMRPVRTRDLPGDVPGLGLVARWRARLIFGLAEWPMRWAAREMGRLPARCQDMTEPITDPAEADAHAVRLALLRRRAR